MALPLYTIERAGRVTHEMHSPMTEYFVKTASSTVLEEKAGKPSTSGLERALKEGCKALCLVPSLEKKKLVAISPESGKAVPFDKCLKTILKHGHVASPYGVLLLLDLSCISASPDGLSKLTELLESVLGSVLYTPSPPRYSQHASAGDVPPIPSPEQLRGKIAIICPTAGAVSPDLGPLARLGVGGGCRGPASPADPTLRPGKPVVELTSKQLVHVSASSDDGLNLDNAGSLYYHGVQFVAINCRREKKYLRVLPLQATVAKKANLSLEMHLAGIGESETGYDLHNVTLEHKATKVAVFSDTKPWLAPTGEPSLASLAFVLLDSGVPIGWAGMAIGELRPGKFSLPLMVPGSIRAPLKGAMLEAEVRWL
eukprot:gene5079-28222_t